jgi:hypothetical protein
MLRTAVLVLLRSSFGGRSRLRLGSWPRLWLWSRSWLWWGSWPVLRLRNWSLRRLWTGLGHWLRGGPVLGPILRLLGAELWLLRPGLRLDWPRLLGLDGACLRLLRLNGTNLRWGGTIVGLHGSHLGLAGSDLGLAGANFGLTRSYFRLAGASRLYLRPVVWFAGAKS